MRSTPSVGRGGHAHHEGDVRVVRREHGGVEAALAVAEHADALRIDVVAAAQVVERGAAVSRQVLTVAAA